MRIADLINAKPSLERLSHVSGLKAKVVLSVAKIIVKVNEHLKAFEVVREGFIEQVETIESDSEKKLFIAESNKKLSEVADEPIEIQFDSIKMNDLYLDEEEKFSIQPIDLVNLIELGFVSE